MVAPAKLYSYASPAAWILVCNRYCYFASWIYSALEKNIN